LTGGIKMAQTDNIKLISNNKKAFHDFFIEEKFEAGIELTGTEIKSVRMGNVNLKDSWISIKNLEAFVMGMHISPYEKGNIFNKDPLRIRKLLLHKREILKLFSKVSQDGYSIVPLSVYLKGSKAKMEIALAKGKKLYDKRDDAAKKSAKREIERAVKERF
jgi:SsrA-binding protein